SPKHLATLEPAISTAQTQQMRAHNIQLVLPRAIHSSYLPDQQGELMSVGDFLLLAKEKGRSFPSDPS
ncbi:MAG TPA: type II restriction endonuclease, partial [Sphingomicrobium sp.]|nr:type II restriction endonuclease [Sphingomicrobium sp.]